MIHMHSANAWYIRPRKLLIHCLEFYKFAYRKIGGRSFCKCLGQNYHAVIATSTSCKKVSVLSMFGFVQNTAKT